MTRAKSRILIVDDSRTIRSALSAHLALKGFEATAVKSGEEALRCLETERFDLVLLDVMMEGLDGLEVLRRIRQEYSKLDLPVLMTTARAESIDVVRALDLGANDYITKPIDLPIALARIASQLHTREEVRSPGVRATLEPDGTLPAGTVLDGRYTLGDQLGAGGFAVVYRALQKTTGQAVAVKILRARRALTPGQANEELERFRREMRVIAELNHPNIVRLIDSGWVEVSPAQTVGRLEKAALDDLEATVTAPSEAREVVEESKTKLALRVPFTVMELLDGESLRALARREGPLDVLRTVDLLLPVLSATWAAHARGVIHRDLKPANIFLARGEQGSIRPTVLDFGTAKLLSDPSAEITAVTSLVGTPGYWSPEQARGLSIDERADQYTLGGTLYQCVTARRPFSGAGYELIQQVAQNRFDPPSKLVDLPDGFEAVLLRSMANEPDERFPNVRALARGLLPYASERARAQWEPAFAEGGTVPPPLGK